MTKNESKQESKLGKITNDQKIEIDGKSRRGETQPKSNIIENRQKTKMTKNGK